MRNISKDTLDLIKSEKVSVLLVYMEGCYACGMIKEPYKTMSNNFNNISFFKGEFNDINEFYLQFADENPDVYDVETQKPAKKVLVPMFYVFVQKEQNEENPWGYVGGIDGADLNTLAHVLQALNNV
jgi:hypothetical protein